MNRFLGMVAAVDSGLQRVRVNFVPLNYALLAVLTGFSVMSVLDLRSHPKSSDPRPVSITSLARGEVPAGTYVTLEATIDSRYEIEVSQTSSRSTRSGIGRGLAILGGVLAQRSGSTLSRMFPLVDDSGNWGLLMAPSSGPRQSGRMQVTGMVRDLPKAASDVLDREWANLPSRMNVELMLASGEKPTSVAMAMLKLAVCLPLALALACVRVKRSQLFRANEAATSRARPSTATIS